MRFLMMHKMTDDMEKGLPPDPAIMEGVGALVADAVQQNLFLSGEGLKPSSERLHVAYANGKRTVTRGPFVDPKELIAGFALLRVASEDEALAWTDRLAETIGDIAVFVGPVVELWDMGLGPKPDGAPRRFLVLPQLTTRTDDESHADQRAALLRPLFAEMTSAGVLEASGGLASTKKSARIRFRAGTHTVIDGPFAESKELVAGYAIFELPSLAVALEWATRFGNIVKVNEVEIRPLT